MTSTDLSPDLSPDRSPGPVPLADLESELLGLAGHIAAAQSRFLTLLAEFDRRAGWAGPGLRSCAHWLSWRAGMNLRTATEHVRVAHALTRLPLVAAAFTAGRVSYSKVRAITRVAVSAAATDDTDHQSDTDRVESGGLGLDDHGEPTRPAPGAPTGEKVLLDLALAGTASHVERVVRAARRLAADPDAQTARRSVSWRWAEDGSLVLRARLDPAAGAAVIAALDEATGPTTARRSNDDPPAPPDVAERGAEQAPGAVVDGTAARRADALVDLLVREVPGGAGPVVARGRTRNARRMNAGRAARTLCLEKP